jgi:glycine hydroxymethyltransferase
LQSEVFSPQSKAFLVEVAERIAAWRPAQIAQRIEEIVRLHDDWRATDCLNMNPAEGVLSPLARRLLATDMATRASEGAPGDKTFPHYRQNEFIDEIEGVILALVKRQFGAKFVEWRPVSTSMANAVVFFALLEHDASILVQDMDGGGNFSHQLDGPAGLRSSNISYIRPAGATFEIDLDVAARAIAETKPKMIVIGGGKVLFPYPLRELRQLADEAGALILYDAAHLGLLISCGAFQRPLDEGAHVVTISTAKAFGGPVGGLILTNDEDIATRVNRLTFPGVLQTRDQNKFASLAIALAEHQAFGKALAERAVTNARALAAALSGEGFSVLGRDGVHTCTHQVFVELGDGAAAKSFERRCNAANILVPDCALTGDGAHGRRSGARMATHELSSRGMGPAEMAEIARLIRRVSASDDEIPAVAEDVRALLARFDREAFGFKPTIERTVSDPAATRG